RLDALRLPRPGRRLLTRREPWPPPGVQPSMPGRLPLAFVLTLAFTSTRAAAAEATPPVDELYQTARRHHQAGEYRRAATLFAEVVTRAPDGRLAVYAAELLFDSLSLLGAIDELGGWV